MKENTMDVVLYGQLYNEAMMGMDTLFEDMKDSLKNFNKKNYPTVFENMMKKYGRVWLCVEEIYNHEENKEAWVNKLAERFVGYAIDLINSQKRKFQKENVKIDCNMFVVTYVIPMIVEYKGNMSEDFAQAIADCWNENFGTQMECGNYETIFKGFKTSILGIPIGK